VAKNRYSIDETTKQGAKDKLGETRSKVGKKIEDRKAEKSEAKDKGKSKPDVAAEIDKDLANQEIDTALRAPEVTPMAGNEAGQQAVKEAKYGQDLDPDQFLKDAQGRGGQGLMDLNQAAEQAAAAVTDGFTWKGGGDFVYTYQATPQGGMIRGVNPKTGNPFVIREGEKFYDDIMGEYRRGDFEPVAGLPSPKAAAPEPVPSPAPEPAPEPVAAEPAPAEPSPVVTEPVAAGPAAAPEGIARPGYTGDWQDAYRAAQAATSPTPGLAPEGIVRPEYKDAIPVDVEADPYAGSDLPPHVAAAVEQALVAQEALPSDMKKATEIVAKRHAVLDEARALESALATSVTKEAATARLLRLIEANPEMRREILAAAGQQGSGLGAPEPLGGPTALNPSGQ
jgi:hypothetical protein